MNFHSVVCSSGVVVVLTYIYRYIYYNNNNIIFFKKEHKNQNQPLANHRIFLCVDHSHENS